MLDALTRWLRRAPDAQDFATGRDTLNANLASGYKGNDPWGMNKFFVQPEDYQTAGENWMAGRADPFKGLRRFELQPEDWHAAGANLFAGAPLPESPYPGGSQKTENFFSSYRPRTSPASPPHLELDENMTPVQKRTKIATFGTQGDGRYTDSSAKKLYRDLALFSLVDDFGGIVGSVLPVERQYGANVLGLSKTGTDEDFLKALARGTYG